MASSRYRAPKGPSPIPCRRLRAALEAARGRDENFEAAWPRAVTLALRGRGDGYEDWSRAFDDTRSAWQSAYERSGKPVLLSAALFVDGEL